MSEIIGLGLDEELEQGVDEPKNDVFDITARRAKRPPFITWDTGAEQYKLKLTASAIAKVEQRFKKNLLAVVTDDGIPPVTTMLTIIQAAMLQYHHGMTFQRVQNAYDAYVESGGNQTKLLSETIMPLLGISGFFTDSQMEILTEEMKEADSPM